MATQRRWTRSSAAAARATPSRRSSTPTGPVRPAGHGRERHPRVLLGSPVLIAPLHPPVPLARSLTTIDFVSGGRLLPGFGFGWSPEGYQAAGLDFSRRGARMDELLDALEPLRTEDPAQYKGVQLSIPLHN
ncbi:LLM class flavin-dependent oxidoreductase [Streptomyces sp. NPDC056105]|uniref:LLM class flavin-dependent oxidoreductase n=1 Tax=Streptomyces sp. NPDC056105 TaxID=3345714 RepID=UPI0035E2DC1F